jgi:D-arabinose 1-dehydrogenase-like Zn-dependent alcohol dehydrogenase
MATSAASVGTMKATQISKAGGEFEEAYERMHSGKVRFRVVLMMGS